MSARARLVSAYRALVARGKLDMAKVPEALREEVAGNV